MGSRTMQLVGGPSHRRAVLAVALGVTAVGCAGEPGGGTGSPAGTGSVSASSSGASSGTAAVETTGPEGSPEVIDIGHDVLLLREGEAVVLTAVVFDPDDDVRTGELLGPGQPALYAALEPGQSGRWRGTVRWSDVHERWPLRFERELELPFTLRFVDAQGHVAEGQTTVRAVCGGLRQTACDGVCVDVQIDPAHCGGCDSSCMASEGVGELESGGGCLNGLCQPWWSACLQPESDTSCAEQCAALGSQCAPAGCGGHTVVRYEGPGDCVQGSGGATEGLGCGDALPRSSAALRCCCL